MEEDGWKDGAKLEVGCPEGTVLGVSDGWIDTVGRWETDGSCDGPMDEVGNCDIDGVCEGASICRPSTRLVVLLRIEIAQGVLYRTDPLQMMALLVIVPAMLVPTPSRILRYSSCDTTQSFVKESAPVTAVVGSPTLLPPSTPSTFK